MWNIEFVALVSCCAVVVIALYVAASMMVAAHPDEWLLHIRGGKPVRMGIGARVLRLPLDVVVRFTSTVQRVAFEATVQTSEHLSVVVEGFALWGVDGEGEGPLKAYRNLGIANLQHRPADLRSVRHLLAAPQYKAFQALVSSCVQQIASKRTLDHMLTDQPSLRDALADSLRDSTRGLGVQIHQVHISGVRAAQAELMTHLAAESETIIRSKAEVVRVQGQEQLAALQATSSTARANELERAKMEQETFAAARQAELEQVRLQLAREQAQCRKELMAVERDTALDQQACDALVRQSQLAHDKAEQEARDALAALHHAAEQLVRRAELDFDLVRTRSTAQAQADAIAVVATAEEGKSLGLREQQLVETVATRISEAVGSLPIHDVHWNTWSADSPLAGMGRALVEVRQLLHEAAAPKPGSDQDSSS